MTSHAFKTTPRSISINIVNIELFRTNREIKLRQILTTLAKYIEAIGRIVVGDLDLDKKIDKKNRQKIRQVLRQRLKQRLRQRLRQRHRQRHRHRLRQRHRQRLI